MGLSQFRQAGFKSCHFLGLKSLVKWVNLSVVQFHSMLNVNNISQVIGLLRGINWDRSRKGLASTWHLDSDQWKLAFITNDQQTRTWYYYFHSSLLNCNCIGEHPTRVRHCPVCWGVKIWWKYGSSLQLLRIDGVELDTYTPDSNEGITEAQTTSTNHEDREESLSFLFEVGRRVVQVITGAGPGSTSKNLRRNWECEGIFWCNIINGEMESCGDCSEWSYLTRSMHDMKRKAGTLESLAQPVFGSAFIPWLCDVEPHHMWNI